MWAHATMGAISALAGALAPPGGGEATLTIEPVCYGGRVAIDRVERGRLPSPGLTVAPGLHVVEVLCEGRAPWGTVVFLSAGESGRVVPAPAAASVPNAPSSPIGEPRAAPAEPAPRFAVSGRVEARTEALRSEGPTRELVHVWSLAYGQLEPDREGWRLDAMPAARHVLPADGVDAHTVARLEALQLRTPRHSGFGLQAGRWPRVVPGEASERIEGARVSWARGGLDASVAGVHRVEASSVGGELGLRAGGERGMASAWFEAGERGTRAATALAWTGDALGPAGLKLGTATDGATPTFGEMAGTWAGDRAELLAGWRYRAHAEPGSPPLLTSAAVALDGVPGAYGLARGAVRAADVRLTLEGRLGAEGRAADATAHVDGPRVRLVVAGHLLEAAQPPLPWRWTALQVGAEARPHPRVRLAAAVGPERAVGPPGEAVVVLGPGGRGELAVGLDADVWLVGRFAGGTVGRVEDGLTGSGGPRRGWQAGIALEIW